MKTQFDKRKNTASKQQPFNFYRLEALFLDGTSDTLINIVHSKIKQAKSKVAKK